MSWSLLMFPLHIAVEKGGWEWVASAESFGLPDEPPPPRELPTAAQVLSALREAGSHGTPWFEVAEQDVTSYLPPCPAPATCHDAEGADVGEVSLGGDGDPWELDRTVTDVSFRKPYGPAVLAVAVALAERGGPMLVVDGGGEEVFVVSPGDDPTHLARHWPW
ncbi:hypothetical protein [Micromonospora musae]|uniref:hypothetical protein n=1 Tax=Micromonospora musae TaxID=1894970 RepID=UPI0033E6D0FC